MLAPATAGAGCSNEPSSMLHPHAPCTRGGPSSANGGGGQDGSGLLVLDED